ncbi:hypothetical protein DL96DRAFT_1711969 [Flagelloscypha sp. PMI_526]|nr:hypothetical protein DL96DRAFT_1711969 [Flagelloscypha sp. PMI_526]
MSSNSNNLKSDSMLSLLPKSLKMKKSTSPKSDQVTPSLDLSSSSNFSKEAKKNGWASSVAVRPSLGGV